MFYTLRPDVLVGLFMLKSNNSQLTLYFKKMKKYLLLSIVFSLFLCGCTQKQSESNESSGMETIPITDFETYNGRFSEFAEAVEMIPLEFTDESILGEIKKVVLSEDFIFVMERFNSAGIYTFDRNGKFLYRIGSRGQGPKECADVDDFSINEKDRLIYIYDSVRKKVFVFSFDNEFIKTIPMDYSATNMEYQDGLFYLYREDARYGVPLYSLVIKDINGDLVEKYYPMSDLPKSHDCVFCKRENDILFAQDMNDSVFVLSGEKLSPVYYIDYKDRSMAPEDRMDIKHDVRRSIDVLLEKRTIAGIQGVFEIHDKVFIKSINVIVPVLSIYDKVKKEVKTYQYWNDDFLFIGSGHPIGQYKDYLLLLQDVEQIQGSLDYFDRWIEDGYLDLNKNKADKIRKLVDEKLPNRDTDECNPVLFMVKVKE